MRSLCRNNELSTPPPSHPLTRTMVMMMMVTVMVMVKMVMMKMVMVKMVMMVMLVMIMLVKMNYSVNHHTPILTQTKLHDCTKI